MGEEKVEEYLLLSTEKFLMLLVEAGFTAQVLETRLLRLRFFSASIIIDSDRAPVQGSG